MQKLLTGVLTLLHSERPKLYAILAFLSAIGLNFRLHGMLIHSPTDSAVFNEQK